MAESVNGLYKTELIRQGPWRNVEHVELATLASVDWFNERRPHGEHGVGAGDAKAGQRQGHDRVRYRRLQGRDVVGRPPSKSSVRAGWCRSITAGCSSRCTPAGIPSRSTAPAFNAAGSRG